MDAVPERRTFSLFYFPSLFHVQARNAVPPPVARGQKFRIRTRLTSKWSRLWVEHVSGAGYKRPKRGSGPAKEPRAALTYRPRPRSDWSSWPASCGKLRQETVRYRGGNRNGDGRHRSNSIRPCRSERSCGRMSCATVGHHNKCDGDGTHILLPGTCSHRSRAAPAEANIGSVQWTVRQSPFWPFALLGRSGFSG